MVDKHAFLNDEKLGSNSNFTNPWMSWDGYYGWEHHCHYFIELGQVLRSSWGINCLLMGMFWVWKWFCVPRLLHRHYCSSKGKYIFFLHQMHYVTHWTKFIIIILSMLPLVSCIETILQALYMFFVHALENTLSFPSL